MNISQEAKAYSEKGNDVRNESSSAATSTPELSLRELIKMPIMSSAKLVMLLMLDLVLWLLHLVFALVAPSAGP